MARSRFALLFAACLAFGALAPRPAAASAFAPEWSISGWTFVTSLGNTDGDPQPELLFYSNSDGHYAVFDGQSGALQQEFPDFDYPNCNVVALDIDYAGPSELIFSGGYSGPALCRAYHWNGSGYSALWQHTERFDGIALAQVRTGTPPDLVEFASDEVRVRDVRGPVVWRSGQIGPPLGAYANCFPVDLDNNGVKELLIQGRNPTSGSYTCFMVKYSGGAFVPQWNLTDWYFKFAASTQNTSAIQVVMDNTVDGHFAIFQGLTGALVADFPGFSGFTGAQFIPVQLNPRGGRTELILWQPPSQAPPAAPKFQAIRWGGAGYDTFISHTDPITFFNYASHRDTFETEFVEVDQDAGDVRIRDASGSVLFRASTGILGWPVGPKPGLYAGGIDVAHDGTGLQRVLIQDLGSATRLVSYSGIFSQSWVVNGWDLGGDAGNTDDDPQYEILGNQVANGTFGLFDGLTGVLAFNPPDFTLSNSSVQPYDADGDGRNELLFVRPGYSPVGSPPLLEQFQWNGSGYVSMFQHADSLVGAGPVRLRGGTHRELLEYTTSGDLLLRDAVSGALLFSASTGVPGWIPLDPYGSTPFTTGDFDGDGVDEVLITDQGTTILIGNSGTTAVPGAGAPVVFRVLPSAPNPFRVATTLRFELPRAGQVGVRVFDTAGRLVRRLDRTLPAGPNALVWDGLDEAGNPAPNGVLFYQVTADGVRQTSKIVRMR